MKQQWNKIPKRWIAYSVIFLVLVQILFYIPAPTEWLVAAWGAGDLISFVGTITLGFIAIAQTENEHRINKRLMELELNRYKLEIRPFVMLEDWSTSIESIHDIMWGEKNKKIFVGVARGDDIGGQFCLSIRLTNTTQSYVSVEYAGITYVNEDKELKWKMSWLNEENQKLMLSAGCSGSFAFWGKREGVIEPVKGKRVRFSFTLENRFGERYQEDIEAVMLIMENPQEGELPYVSIRTQSYRVGKFVQGKDGKKYLVWEDGDDGQS